MEDAIKEAFCYESAERSVASINLVGGIEQYLIDDYDRITGEDGTTFVNDGSSQGTINCENDLSNEYGENEPETDLKKKDQILSIQRVQFSAVVPDLVERGMYGIINLIMYEKEFRSVVDRIISQSDELLKETPAGMMIVRQMSRIRIRVYSPDIVLDNKFGWHEEERVWAGEYIVFSLPIYVPEQYEKKQIFFKAEVFIDDVIGATLAFVVNIGEGRQILTIHQNNIMSAFVSYASEDRARVAAIIQGMRKVRPDLDVFLDVEKLRSGE